MADTFPLRPRDIFEELRKSVVGQDDAIREISVALVKHLVGQPAPNILLIGNSGSGKTTLMRAVEHFLVDTPDLGGYANVVRLNANVLAEERQGYGRVVLGRLYENARRILGPGATSVWNTVRPAQVRDEEAERHANPAQTFAWVHVSDLARLAADLATGAIATTDDRSTGPVAGGCTPVNVAAGPATQRDYLGAVCEALRLETTWDEGPAWTGQILADRARRWGWTPRVDLASALEELKDGLR